MKLPFLFAIQHRPSELIIRDTYLLEPFAKFNEKIYSKTFDIKSH